MRGEQGIAVNSHRPVSLPRRFKNIATHSHKPRRRSSIGEHISNVLNSTMKRRSTSCTSQSSTTATAPSSRRVSFRSVVEISCVASVRDMTSEEKQRRWITDEDKTQSKEDLMLNVLALRCTQLSERDISIRTSDVSHFTSTISNRTEVCYRGIEHFKSKMSQKVQRTIKSEHVTSILREQQAYRHEIGRTRGTPARHLAKLSRQNSRYSRERAIKLAALDEEYVNQLRRQEEQEKEEEGDQDDSTDTSVSSFSLTSPLAQEEGQVEEIFQQRLRIEVDGQQASGQQTNEKKTQHRTANVGMNNVQRVQSFPSCA